MSEHLPQITMCKEYFLKNIVIKFMLSCYYKLIILVYEKRCVCDQLMRQASREPFALPRSEPDKRSIDWYSYTLK